MKMVLFLSVLVPPLFDIRVLTTLQIAAMFEILTGLVRVAENLSSALSKILSIENHENVLYP